MKKAILVVLILSVINPCLGKYPGGTGTAEDPYQIATAEDLNDIGNHIEDFNKCFVLTNDVNLECYTGTQFNIIGDWYTPFSGKFDGNDHVISNFTWESTGIAWVGIFGCVRGADAIIHNLGLVNANVFEGSTSYVASLIGWLEDGTVDRCYVEDCNVTGDMAVGGLVGYQYNGTITNCHSKGSVSGDIQTGGLVGCNRGLISYCQAIASVKARQSVGGLVGLNAQDGVISKSFSTASVIGQEFFAGGLVGENSDATITCSFSSGSVTGGSYFAGGLAGFSSSSVPFFSVISDCYSTCSVSGTATDAGGLVGQNNLSRIQNCYSSGTVEGTSGIGGLVGNDVNGAIAGSFWDVNASVQTTSDGGTGKTTSEMKTSSTFMEAGWDFVGETTNGTEDIWQIIENVTYPKLSWQPLKYSGGTGEPNTPYQIANVTDLMTLSADANDYNKCFIMTGNINLTGMNFTKAPISQFTGVFDGNSNTISNLTINASEKDQIALFGYVGEDGQIKNLNLINANIKGQSYVGVLAGLNYGSISDCNSTGTVSGLLVVGSLAGDNRGVIFNCYSTGTVSSDLLSAGGLVGENYSGNIINCYSTSSVSGNSSTGGLVGSNGGGIINCYSTGKVAGPIGGASRNVGGLVGRNSGGSVFGSFWDINTSCQSSSDGGTGKTTAAMKTLSTFTSAGWDFVNETINGTCNYWQMPAGAYPVLSTFNGYIPPQPDGNGTQQNPYIIDDATDLGTIWYRPDAHYILADNINLAGISWSVAVVPVFRGVLDGNSFYINNLSITGTVNLGLFGRIEAGGLVKKLGIRDCNIIGSSYVGGLSGYSEIDINNCYSTGNVNGSSYIGGLVGQNMGDINNCYSTGSVSGSTFYVGGLAGDNNEGNITNCCSTGLVSGSSSDAGGLVGVNSGDIINCYSTGSVCGFSQVGGLVGSNREGIITDCYSKGSVSSSSNYVGGLAGINFWGSINNCYSTGSVNGFSDYVGGLVGYNRSGGSIILNCYSTGLVSGSSYVGGLVGSSYDSVSDSFWDMQTSGQTSGVGYGDSNGITGKTTAEMKTKSTFTDAGWDFVGEMTNGTEDIWSISNGVTYPKLFWEDPIMANMNLNSLWMYQNLPGQDKSRITATLDFIDDPCENSSYTYYWSFELPDDVSVEPVTVAGGGINDTSWTFAAGECTDTGGLSDSGQAFKVIVEIVGNDFGNYGIMEKEFGVALLGDVDNNGKVDADDRSMVNLFWKTKSAGPYTLKDCDMDCNGKVDSDDRSMVNLIWKRALPGIKNSVSRPCPLR